MPSFSSPVPVEAVLDVGAAHVVVEALDESTEVGVEITPSDPARDADVALARDSRVEFDENRLRVHVPKRTRLFGRTESVDVHVRVPAGSALDVTSRYGDVRVRGTLGRTTVSVAYGQTRLERTGDLRLASPHGEIEVGAVEGDLDVRSGHGRARFDRVSGDVELQGTHGRVEFGDVGGSVRASLAGGLTIGCAHGPVEATSSYGTVRIGELLGDSAGVRTSYEAIEVGIPQDVATWLDASSQHGTVRTDLPPREAPAGDERRVELHLHSGHGNILVHRA